MTDIAQIRAQIRDFCRKHHLFDPGVVLIGVSGGVDSLALLHLLHALSVDLSIRLHVATLDHGLRGADGAADAEFVRQTATEWGIPVIVGQQNVGALAKAQGIGIEDAARQVRYQFLMTAAHALGTRQIAVAHHRNDQAETVLMHLLRGSGLTGLRGMLPVTSIHSDTLPNRDPHDQFRLVRPLLDTPRAAIDSYAAAHHLHPRIDVTNADPTYARNRVRLEILPVLRTVNPALDTALAHTAEIARADYEALHWALTSQLPDWPLVANRAVFQTLPRGLQRLAVHQLVPEWRFAQVEALIDWLLTATAGAVYPLPTNAALILSFDQIRCAAGEQLTRLTGAPGCPLLTGTADYPISLPSTVELPDGWQLETTPYRPDPAHDSAPPDWTDPLATILTIPPAAVITLRTRQSGDRFAPKGLSGHRQKLSDTLIDLKVPAAWRDSLPLLTVNDQIAWFVAPTPDGLKARVAEAFAWHADSALLSDPPSQSWRVTFRLLHGLP